MRKKLIALFGVSASALGVAACTSAQEQAVLNDIKTFCETLPIGVAIVVTVVSSIPTIAAGGSVIQTVGNTAASVCTSLVTDLQKIIDNINGNGGTATVSVTSQSTASLSRLKSTILHHYPTARSTLKAGGTVLTFTIPPASTPFGL